MSYMTTQKAQTLISDMIDEVIEVTNPEGTLPFDSYMNVGEMTRGEEVNYRIAGFGLPTEREIAAKRITGDYDCRESIDVT